MTQRGLLTPPAALRVKLERLINCWGGNEGGEQGQSYEGEGAREEKLKLEDRR